MPQDDNLQRLLNTGKAFEGAAIPPATREGFRVKAIDNLRILRKRNMPGGTEIVLGFSEENTENKTLYYVMAFVGDGLKWIGNNSLTSTLREVKNIQGPYVVFGSPATIFVQSEVRVPCVLTVTTRTPGGIVSELDSQPSVSTLIEPVSCYHGLFTAAHTLPIDKPGFVSIDSGTYTVTLPNISEVPEGYELEVKNIGTGTITVSGGSNIDGAASDVISTRYTAHRYLATSGNWYII